MVSSSSGTQDRKRKPGSRDVTNEVRPMRKKVNGEVAYGDNWPRMAETLFYLLRFTMLTGTMDWVEMGRVRGESARSRAEPQVEIVKCFDGVDVKKHAAGEPPTGREGR